MKDKDYEENKKNLIAAIIFAAACFVTVAFYEVILPLWFIN